MPVFKKTSSNLYKNTAPKITDYSNYIVPRNKADEKFYSTRMIIVKAQLKSMLLPFIYKLFKKNPEKKLNALT